MIETAPEGMQPGKSRMREWSDARRLWNAGVLCDVFFHSLARGLRKRGRDIHRRERNCVVIDGRIGGLCRFIYRYTPVFTTS